MKYEMKEMTVQCGDNKVYVQINMPVGATTPVPALVLSHGYNSSFADLSDMAAAAAKVGIAAVSLDFCGGSLRSKSDGSTIEMTIASEKANLLSVIEAVKKLPEVNKDKLFLYGESQGGFVSALVAAEMGTEITAIALLYPALCIPDNMEELKRKDLPEPFMFMGMPLSHNFVESVPKENVYDSISRYPNPALIIHGDSDRLVRVSYSQKLEKCMPKAELVVVPGEGHGFSPEQRRAMVEKVCDFLLKNS